MTDDMRQILKWLDTIFCEGSRHARPLYIQIFHIFFGHNSKNVSKTIFSRMCNLTRQIRNLVLFIRYRVEIELSKLLQVVKIVISDQAQSHQI